MNFDVEYYKEQIKFRDEILKATKRYKELDNSLTKLENETHFIENRIKESENKIKEYLDEIDKYKRVLSNIFKFTERSSAKNRIKGLNKEIETQKEYIKINKDKLKELKELLLQQSEQIKKEKESIESYKALYKEDLGEAIGLEDGVITIYDKGSIGNFILDENKEVLVHTSNHFIKDNKILCGYEGGKKHKVKVDYNGKERFVDIRSHRHTVHFTINNIVKANPYGNWDQKKYIFILPLDSHKDQIVHLNPSDSWTYGSLKVKDKPLILVRNDVYESITDEDKEKYTFIKYNGEYDICADNALQLCGIKGKDYDAHDAHHMNSAYFEMEKNLQYRDVILGYLLQNSFDDKIYLDDVSKIKLSQEQLFELYEMMNDAKYNVLENDSDVEFSKLGSTTCIMDNNMIYKYSEKNDIPNNFIHFIITQGIEKKDDSYILKTDDRIYEDYKKYAIFMSDSSLNDEEKYNKFISLFKLDTFKQEFEIIREKEKEKKDKEKEEKEMEKISKELDKLHSKPLNLLSNEELNTLLNAINFKLQNGSKSCKDFQCDFEVVFNYCDITEEDIELFNETGSIYFKPFKAGIHLRVNNFLPVCSKITGFDSNTLSYILNIISDKPKEKLTEDELHILNQLFNAMSLHFVNMDTTDFDWSNCKTVGEFETSVMKYAECFSKYVSGQKIMFDTYGNELPYDSTIDFQRVDMENENMRL